MVQIEKPQQNTQNTVYIGIVTYNSVSVITQCIQNLKKQTYKRIKIVVYDNGSNDSTCDTLRKIKGVTFIEGKINLGYGGGHNAILKRISLQKYDYYVTINPDAFLSDTYIEKLLFSLLQHKAAWGIGKLYKDLKHKTIYSTGHALFPDGYIVNIGYDIKDNGQFSLSREVFGAPGAAAMYSYQCIQSVLRKGNFFDSKIFLYYEDTDIDWRAKLSGLHCWYEPKAIGVHGGGAPKGFNIIRALVNRYRSAIKNSFPADLFRYVFPMMFVHSLFRFATSPFSGLCFIGLMISMIPSALLQRTEPVISYEEIHKWFTWSLTQDTKSPITLVGRLRTFRHTV